MSPNRDDTRTPHADAMSLTHADAMTPSDDTR
jgi:hypothetical protein